MTREELLDSLGTIARSGTAKFVQALKVSFCSQKYSLFGVEACPKVCEGLCSLDHPTKSSVNKAVVYMVVPQAAGAVSSGHH